jgi:hypothetical protein
LEGQKVLFQKEGIEFSYKCSKMYNYFKTWRVESQEGKMEKHGESRGKLYTIWQAMLNRCTNPNHNRYKNYGKKGVKVFPPWIISYSAFRDYVSKLDRFGEKGMTLDRIDANKGYQPGNIRWATQKEQQRNRTNNRTVEYQGRTQTISAWAEEIGLNRGTLRARIERGWPIDKAISQPILKEE